MRLLTPIAALFILAVSPSAHGQIDQACSPANSGARICEAGNVCVCRLTGGTMFGMPQACRWDCGIANGACIPGTFVETRGTPSNAIVVTSAAPAPGTPAGLGREQIKKVQQALVRRGYEPGPIDGVFGPRTGAAIKSYQQQEKLPITGLLTPDLVQRLN
jgi:hypothetical protein